MKRFLLITMDINDDPQVEKIKNELNCHTSDQDVEYDGMIIFGGDGRVLRTLSHHRNPPVVYAINYGRVGFLCPILRDEVDELIRRLKNDEEMGFIETKRLCLYPNLHFLNEAVIRSHSNRLNTFKILIDDVSLTMRADAIIVSTRSGSSGYNSSIHGPLLLSECIIVNAVAPNRCGFKPILCGMESRIRVEMDDEPLIILDGIVCEATSFDVFHDGSTVRFGYLDDYDESRRIRNLFFLE